MTLPSTANGFIRKTVKAKFVRQWNSNINQNKNNDEQTNCKNRNNAPFVSHRGMYQQ